MGVLAALAGAVLTVVAFGAIVAAVLYYGNQIGRLEVSDGAVASALLVAFFASPFVGAVVGVWFYRRSRRSRSRSGRNRVPYPSSAPQPSP